MLTTLLILLAAQAQVPSPPSPPPEPHPGPRQVFIAPSGEAFRAPAGAPYPVADWFAGADADHDGKLTESEFTADVLRFVASLDTDRDGAIDGAELERYEAATPELHTGSFVGSWAGSDPEEGGESAPRRRVGSYMGADDPRGAGRYDLLRIPEPVASMDTELKGRITRQQAADAAGYRFSILDTRHRGFLVLAELPETYAQAHHSLAHGHGGGAGGGRHGRWRGGGERERPAAD